MAVKKTYYPSAKKPGIYSDAEGVTDKELGLNNSDLENFSLGNWNSIRKNSKLIVSTDTGALKAATEDPRGRPIHIEWGVPQIASIQFDENGDKYPSTNYPFASFFVKGERVGTFNRLQLTEIFKAGTDYSDDFDDDDTQQSSGAPYQTYVEMDIGDGTFDASSDSGYNRITQPVAWAARKARQRNILSFYANYGGGQGNQREFTINSVKNNKQITKEDGFAFIKERPGASSVQQKYVIEFDNNLLEKMRELIYIREVPAYENSGNSAGDPNDLHIDEKEDGLEFFAQFERMGGRTWEIVFPRFFKIINPSGDETYGDGVIIELAVSKDGVPQPLLPRPRIGDSNNTFDISGQTDNDILNQLFSSDNFLEFSLLNAEDDNYTPFFINSDSDSYFKQLGFPDFQYNGLLSHNVNLDRVLFEVICNNKDGEDLLYWENGSNKYLDTSYPLEVTLEMSLFNGRTNVSIQLEDNRDVSEFDSLTLSYSNLANFNAQNFIADEVRSAPDKSFYRYQVIQWGDEKNLLTDEQIEGTYFFNFYDKDEYPAPNDYNILRYNQEIIYNSNSFRDTLSHTYLTPGVKSIKIVVYRYSKTGKYITETYLVTKNIVINDGLFTSQDFSIFGASDFNFLPLDENQAIIGGFDEDSKYNNSVSKIVKDDNFSQDEYLERVSSRNYIEKFNGNFLGKRPGQLDLGQTRIFKESKDIYDFIGGDKLDWINNGSGSLPINSLATDIFIRDDNCIVDLNPSNSEYSTIQNQAGLEEIGILIGDYRVNQLDNGKIQKQGVMEIPLLETDNNKQAF